MRVRQLKIVGEVRDKNKLSCLLPAVGNKFAKIVGEVRDKNKLSCLLPAVGNKFANC